MATIAITGFVSLAAASRQQDDLIPIVDVHDFTQGPTGSTKKITVANLFTNVVGVGTMTGYTTITATNFSGGGASLTALNATQLTNGTVPNARLAGAYSGITSLGSLTGLVTAGISNSGITNTVGLVSTNGVTVGGALVGATTGNFSGAVTALSFTGNGPLITNLAAANLTGTVPNGVMNGAYTGITGLGTLVNLTVTNPIGGSVTGNAGTATVLQTARTINGTSFNGSANITVAAAAGTLTGATLAAGVTASSLTSVGTLTALTVSGIATVGAVKGGGSAPTVTPPAGNGSCTVTGTDTAGFINWTVASTTSAAFSITLTFNTPLAANPYALISLGGGSLAAAPILYAFGSTTGISISGQAAAGAPFAAGTVYQFVYHVIS